MMDNVSVHKDSEAVCAPDLSTVLVVGVLWTISLELSDQYNGLQFGWVKFYLYSLT